MAGKYKHIESIYQDAFASHKAKPPKSAWKSMQGSLDNIRLEQLAKARLADTAIKPASSIWSRIAGKMFWPNFMHFNPLQFNIYYAGLALLGGGATIVGINTNSQKPEMTARDANPRSFVEYMIAPPATTTRSNLNVSEDKQTADFMEKRNALLEKDTDNAKEERVVNASSSQSAASSGADVNSRSMPKEEIDRPVSENVASVNQPLKTMPAGVEHFAPWRFEFLLAASTEFALRPDTLGFDYKDDPIVKDLNFIEQGWYGGVIMLKQNITFMNNEVRETYQQNNKVSDFSYRIGLRVNIVRKNFMLQTGLYFASINNKFEHNQEIAIIEDDIDGRVIWPYQSDTVYRQTTHTYHNTYRYVELPLLAGLHLEGRRFATNIKTGPVVNYLTGVSADLVLTQDNKLTSVDKSYFKRPGLRWQVSADLIYRFGDRLSFYIEPSYVHDLTNAFNDKVEMESRLSGINVGLGMYYRF